VDTCTFSIVRFDFARILISTTTIWMFFIWWNCWLMKNKLKSMFVEETYFGLVEDACLEEEGTENVVFRSEHN
jgi:hypothetical protein